MHRAIGFTFTAMTFCMTMVRFLASSLCMARKLLHAESPALKRGIRITTCRGLCDLRACRYRSMVRLAAVYIASIHDVRQRWAVFCGPVPLRSAIAAVSQRDFQADRWLEVTSWCSTDLSSELMLRTSGSRVAIQSTSEFHNSKSYGVRDSPRLMPRTNFVCCFIVQLPNMFIVGAHV